MWLLKSISTRMAVLDLSVLTIGEHTGVREDSMTSSCWPEEVVSWGGVILSEGGHCLCPFAVDFERNAKQSPGETNHWAWEQVKPRSSEETGGGGVAGGFIRTTDTHRPVSSKLKNRLGYWRRSISLWIWLMERIKKQELAEVCESK